MDVKDFLSDALVHEKFMTGLYNTCAYEASNAQLKQMFMRHLQEDQEHSFRFNEALRQLNPQQQTTIR